MFSFKKNVALFFVALSIPVLVFAQTQSEHVVFNGKKLSQGYDMGLSSSGGNTSWLNANGKEFIMSYPANQNWGAIFVTVGKPAKSLQERQKKNFSTFDTLVLTMKGENGGESIDVGIKDITDPDDGSETKLPVVLKNTYEEYKFVLKDFRSANLQTLYVVTEFVFSGEQAYKIFVNSIKYK